MEDEAANAGAGIQRGEDEHRLEHDREVIPQRQRGIAGDDLGKHLRHADGEGGRPADFADHVRLAEIAGELLHVFESHRVGGAVGIDGSDLGRHSRSVVRVDRRVDREVFAGMEGAGSDDRHQRDEHFHHHRAVADEADVFLAGQQLRRGARSDQRVKSAHRPAGDGDADEGENGAGHDKAAAIHKRRDGGHLQRRRKDDDEDP